MEIEKGSVVKGKVTGIAKFGAFVELDGGKSGLVYISEISNTFVKDVSDFLKVGQEVQVKVISIDNAGRINLSIKQAMPQAEPARRAPRQAYTAEPAAQSEADPVNADFEDKLKHFMKVSDSKISDMMRQGERRSGSKRRR